MQRAIAHLAAEEIHEHAEAAEEDRQPQVEVLEDPGEDHPILFEVQQGRDVPRLQPAIHELEAGHAPSVEVPEAAIVGPLVDEVGAGRGRDGGEVLSVDARLDVEVPGVGVLVLAARARVLHDEALHRARRAKIHLQEQGPALGAPLIGLPAGDAAVHRVLRTLIGTAGHASRRGAAEREILRRVGAVDLELVDPGDRLSAVRRADDVEADETRVDRGLDHVRGRPVAAAGFAHALGSLAGVFFGGLAKPRPHVLERLSDPDTVHQRRVDRAAPSQPLGPPLRVHAVPQEDEGGKKCQRVDPQSAPRKEDTAKLDRGDRPRLPHPRGE